MSRTIATDRGRGAEAPTPARAAGAGHLLTAAPLPAEDGTARPRATPGPSTVPAPGPGRHTHAHARNFGQLVGSHLGVALAGLVTLPVLARNLGPAAYGHFSLFMTTLGVLSNLDLARPLLVRDLARRSDGDFAGATRLAVTSAHLLAAVALGVGWVLQGPSTAVALAVAVLLHGASSAAYAELSARGLVGVAGSVRNTAWAGALAATTAASFATTTPHAYIWAFAAANLAILVAYQRALRLPLRALAVRPDVGPLRDRAREATDVGLFAAASAVVASSDKVLLESHASAGDFGHYAAQYDLATKINIVSTALGSILLPSLARANEEHGPEATAARFVRFASWVALAYFVAVLGLLTFQREFAAIVLGTEFTRALALDVYALMLVGVFVHLFGFLLTSYQRARGDFRSQRVAYLVSAAAMLLVGLVAVPRYGAAGAVATYLTGRMAELALIAAEVRRMPTTVLPRWRVVALAGMLAVLALYAWRSLAAQGGLPA